MESAPESNVIKNYLCVSLLSRQIFHAVLYENKIKIPPIYISLERAQT